MQYELPYLLLLVGGAITILKNISQWEGLSHILWKLKNVPNHHFVPLCVSHCLGLGRQCFDCGDSMVKTAAKPEPDLETMSLQANKH